uniref:Protein YIPF n=2 Tax=Schistocephalus solidus TaxID=70667 RepID=A0A0X3PL80_SCHSO
MPDLYGPFWITVTLIFAIAFAGSIREYFILQNKSTLTTYNFMRVTITSTLLLTYWCVVPLLIACTAWFRRRKQNTGTEPLVGEDSADLKIGHLFTDLLAVYGYSLTAFVPCSLLLVIPSVLAQAAILVLATALTCTILATATWKTFQHHKKQNVVVFVIVVVVLHLVMALCLSLVFFYQPSATEFPPPSFTAAAALGKNGTANELMGSNPQLSESKNAGAPIEADAVQKAARPPAP